MERSIRLGKDFNVLWSIRKVVDGERQPYELAGKELVLQYRRPNGTLHEAKEWRVDGNIIIWTFRGRDQKAPGLYGLILTENGGKDGMVTVDTCRAFNLVEHSCEETEGSGSDIVIEDVVLESEVAFAALRGPQGERGPEGPQGPQGERGPQGEQGPAGPSYDDTEIKDKLTELSEEVSGLSERVDELGQPIFKAVYGKTTYNEIKSAYESGMVVHCDYIGNCYVLSRIDNNNAYLTCTLGTIVYRIMCSSASTWANATFEAEQVKNKTTSLSESSTDTQYPSAKATFMAISKKSEVSLEALANGNLKVTIDGVSKDFMPATPSGDPMHYMYEKAGAEYNDTGADIVRTGIYGDTIIWKAGYWWLNELGDIANEEMRNIYSYRYTSPSGSQVNSYFQTFRKTRTPMIDVPGRAGALNASYFAYSTSFETVALSQEKDSLVYLSQMTLFVAYSTVKKIINGLDLTFLKAATAITDAFKNATKLQEVRLYYLQVSVQFEQSPLLSNASILYMIENEAAASAIVITLHADAYARAMADAEITAALAAHPNVSLASA